MKDAFTARAAAGSQLPSCGTLPTTYTFWPNVALASTV
jgi:hypothetical protein